MNLVLTGGIPAGAVSPAKAAAALLSPGMLAAHPPTIAPAPNLPPPPALAPPAGLPWEHHPLVQAQVHAALAQRDGLWLMNQLAVVQQQQQQQAAVAACLAAAGNVPGKPVWGDLNGVVTSTVATSNPSVSVSNTVAHSGAKPLVGNPAGVYAPLVHTPYPGSPQAAATPSGLVFLNVPRLSVGLPPQTAPNPYHPKPAPGQVHQGGVAFPPPPGHPPPPHGLLPPLIHSQSPAVALMGLKRSWEQAFPADVQAAAGGVKRPWQPPQAGTSAFHTQAAVPHPGPVAYQPQFYSAL